MKRFLCFLLCLSVTLPALAETRYVSDQLRLPMRKGGSGSFKISRMLPSGTPLEVLSVNRKTGWAQIKTPKGTTGYVLDRYLQDEPVARERIIEIEERLAGLQQAPDQLAAKLGQLQQAHQALIQQHEAITQENDRLTQELAAIRHASENVVRITEERDQLRSETRKLQHEAGNLRQQNMDLGSQSDQRWFLIGAGVLGGGIALGLLLPYLRLRRRSSSWGNSL